VIRNVYLYIFIELVGTRQSMELRRKFNKNKARNTSYRVSKKIEANTKISEQDKKSRFQNMIMINGRRAFVNKRKRQFMRKPISSGDKARSLLTASSPKQGIRADMQEGYLSKDQDVKNALMKHEKTRKELEIQDTKQMKEAMKEHENAEQKNLKMNPNLREKIKHDTFLDKKKAISSTECGNEKYGKPNKLQIPTSPKMNGFSANHEIVKKNQNLYDNSKFFIQMILPEPVFMKPKATTEILLI
jgi:hypothetical protein